MTLPRKSPWIENGHLTKEAKLNLRNKNLGKKLSAETKKKISLANIGRKYSKETIERYRKSKLGNKNPSFGKKQSKETCLKKSLSQRNEKHYNWKGGVSKENKRIRRGIEFRLWREAVFARDNWTCQKYKIRGCKIHPHHIENFSEYPELRFAIDNGITLSEKAHKEFHRRYGMRKNTKAQIEEFINN